MNDRAAIEALLRHGPMARSELEEFIGLSKPATAQLLTRLEESGTVVRTGLRGGSRGPRAQLWAVNAALAHVAAVALSPEAVDVAIAGVTGEILAEHSLPMPKGGTAEVLKAFLDAVTSTAAAAGLTLDGLSHVVVGSPGAIDRATGRLRFAPHLPGWEGFDVQAELSALVGAPVAVENDINLAALEEMNSGRATEVRDFVLIWTAHEVGSAIVVNGSLLRGVSGGAGEIDAMLVPDLAERSQGVDHTGGRYGDLLSSEAIAKLASAHGVVGSSGLSAVRRAVRSGEAGQEFLVDLARRIAVVVANVIVVLDPELVLLSGEVAQAGGDLLNDLVVVEVRRLVQPSTPIHLASVTDNPVRSGALHSALSVAREELFGLSAATTEPFRSQPTG
jgi:predicted NBD/HSP70 family sugar kinase